MPKLYAMYLRIVTGLTVLLLATQVGRAQQIRPDSMLAMEDKLSKQYLSAIADKSDKYVEKIDKQTQRYLAKLEKQEAKIQKKLSKIDSLASMDIFGNAQQQYQQLQNKLKAKTGAVGRVAGQYLPWLDSAGTSLKFLEQYPLAKNLQAGMASVRAASGKIKALQQELKQAADVKDFIRQRKEYLRERLAKYDLGNSLKKYNQTAYYYSQQISEYKEALNDPEKAEKKVLELLNQVPAFQQFMKSNSMLASLFAIPGGNNAGAAGGAVASIPGLQTRSSVTQMIQGQLSAAGPNAQGVLQQNIQAAQNELTKLKNKLEKMGGGNSESDMPDFKPNQQKTKTFLKRLEYGANIQTLRSSSYFPSTSDIALSVGYRLNDKSILGIGASYKMGWGQDIRHIQLSGQGIGIRSFLDMKLKGSFYASGGFEYNYQQPFATPVQLPYLSAWQQSGLVGISKIISLKTKLFKKTRIQFLWDFLSYRQTPVTQPLKFRVGYNF